MMSSSSMNECLPGWSGTTTKRGTTWLGMWTTAREVVGSEVGASRRIEASTHSERLPR
jgi:hypothetical protein